jgi:hypothetical protein
MGCHGRLALETSQEPKWSLELEMFWVSPNVLLHCVMLQFVNGVKSI